MSEDVNQSIDLILYMYEHKESKITYCWSYLHQEGLENYMKSPFLVSGKYKLHEIILIYIRSHFDVLE